MADINGSPDLAEVPSPLAGEVVVAVRGANGKLACVKGPVSKVGLVSLDETVAMLLAAAEKKPYPAVA